MHLSTPPPPLNPDWHHLPSYASASRILCGIMGRRPRRPNLKLCAMRRRSLEGTANNACWGVLFSFLSLRFVFCLSLSLSLLLLLHSVVGIPLLGAGGYEKVPLRECSSWLWLPTSVFRLRSCHAALVVQTHSNYESGSGPGQVNPCCCSIVVAQHIGLLCLVCVCVCVL